MLNTSDSWLIKLQSSGYRLTGSRRVVVKLISESNHALTPMELYEQARLSHSTVGLVTVYRTLEKLEELQLIQRVHQPQGCQAFIAAFNGHQHMILCSVCGKVNFFSGDNLDSFFHTIAKDTGYQVEDHWLQLFGTCTNCLKAKV